MKKILLPMFCLPLLWHIAADAQTVTQLGTPFVQDDVQDMLYTSDGGFVVAGRKGDNAVLYKVDCAGNVVAQIEKNLGVGAVFNECLELPDGSLVATGYAVGVQTPADTLDHLMLLKTNANLIQSAYAHYPLSGKHAQGWSLTFSATDGVLLLFGKIAGFSINFWDFFFLRVNPFTLQPSANPKVYNFGVDNARHIIPVGNNEFLLSGEFLIGNIFVPEAPVSNNLLTLKVNAQGDVVWQYVYNKTYKGKYGFCKSGGIAQQNPATGNIMTAGVMYTGAPDSLVDPVLILLNQQGQPLDTLTAFLPGAQELFRTTPNSVDPGAYFSVGHSLTQGVLPTLFFSNQKDINNQIIVLAAVDDVNTPISLRDITELPVNRFAFTGTLPDNLINLNITNIVVATPAVDNIDILYQNCALTAAFSAPNPSYQWYRDSTPIAGANTGVYFPEQSGVYYVQITDGIGCVGFSDTFKVTLAKADFEMVGANGTYAFTNNSVGADTYSWDFGDGNNSTEANPVHTYTNSGPYPVTLIASNPCGSDTLTQILTGSGDPAWLEYFRLFPNPNAGAFTVEVNGVAQDDLAFTLFNTTGQIVARQIFDFQVGALREHFNFEHLPPGVYTLQIRAGDGAKYVKVALR